MWMWIPSGGGRVLAFAYEDPTAGPSAKGAYADDPPTAEQLQAVLEDPSQTFRQPDAFDATPVKDPKRLGLPAEPPWIVWFRTRVR